MTTTTQQPAAAPADAEEYQQHIDNIFSLKKPRDIRAGLSSGAKSAAKGIALGTAGLFAAPIFGAYTDGVKGFAQGVGAGTLSAVCPSSACNCSTLCAASLPVLAPAARL